MSSAPSSSRPTGPNKNRTTSKTASNSSSSTSTETSVSKSPPPRSSTSAPKADDNTWISAAADDWKSFRESFQETTFPDETWDIPDWAKIERDLLFAQQAPLEEHELSRRQEQVAKPALEPESSPSQGLPSASPEERRRRVELLKSLRGNWMVVDTASLVVEMGESLVNLPAWPPSLYLDSEGERLGRWGTITSLTLYVRPIGAVFIIDTHVLKHAAFDTPFSNGQTLRMILQEQNISKCFWDVRQDSDALHKHYQLCLRGIIDVQLMENLSRERRDPRRWERNTLGKYDAAIAFDAGLSPEISVLCAETKWFGSQVFKSENWELIYRRPMNEDLQIYCALDVDPMARLFDVYHENLTAEEYSEVKIQSALRVDESFWPDDKFEREKKRAWNDPWLAPYSWRRDEREIEIQRRKKEFEDAWVTKKEEKGQRKRIIKVAKPNPSTRKQLPRKSNPESSRPAKVRNTEPRIPKARCCPSKTVNLDEDLTAKDLEISQLKRVEQKHHQQIAELQAKVVHLESKISSKGSSNQRRPCSGSPATRDVNRPASKIRSTKEIPGVEEWLRKRCSSTAKAEASKANSPTMGTPRISSRKQPITRPLSARKAME